MNPHIKKSVVFQFSLHEPTPKSIVNINDTFPKSKNQVITAINFFIETNQELNAVKPVQVYGYLFLLQ